MKTYVVTGWSGKMNGLLVVVQAEDEDGALTKVVDPSRILVKIDGDTYLVSKERGEEYIREQLACDELDWAYQLAVDEVEFGKNCDKAVLW